MHCPECGFELQPGDEFCINCGAAIDTEPKPEIRKKKTKFHVWPLIVVLAFIGLAVGTIAYVLNLPMVTFARSCLGTAWDYKDNEVLKTIRTAGKGGSIDISADISDLIDGFGIPMLSEMEARAGIKMYMDSEADVVCTNVTGSLGGSNAIDAKLWTSLEESIVQSDTLIGREAFGVKYGSESDLRNLENLIQEATYFDLSEYNKYLDMARYYQENKDRINTMLSIKACCYMFKYATVESSKETEFTEGKKIKNTVIKLSFDRNQYVEYINALAAWCEGYEPTAGLLGYLDDDAIENLCDAFDDDFYAEFEYRIGNSSKGTWLTLLSLTETIGTLETTVNYDDGFRIDAADDQVEMSVSWDSESGDWDIIFNDENIASGSLYSDKAGTVELEIEDVPVDITILAEDKMPEIPEFTELRSREDFEEFGEQVYGNVWDMAMRLVSVQDFSGGYDTDQEVYEYETEASEEYVTEPETETEPELWTEPALETESESETETEMEIESETETEAVTEAETAPLPEKPVQGTYYYDDGNTFSVNFQTGEYQEHVTVIAEINKDGTYTLTYSNGIFQYDDFGTYTCDKKNHMTFASATGIDATGEYHEKYIEVTIPGYMTGKLEKIK